jgi:RNA polymerase sigma-70 factor (ECF subfamily)
MNNSQSVTAPQLTDEEIVNRVLGGEKELYELIIRRHNRRLFRIGISIVKDDYEAEELMQETYVKAYEKLHQFQQRSAFGTWLTRIMINEALIKMKRNQRFVYDSKLLQNDNLSQPYHMKTPEHVTINNELKTILEKAILNLPEKYRMVYVMREVERMNVEEASSILNISDANVKVRLNRAKAMLREQITRQYEETDVFPFHLVRCDRIVVAVMNRI